MEMFFNQSLMSSLIQRMIFIGCPQPASLFSFFSVVLLSSYITPSLYFIDSILSWHLAPWYLSAILFNHLTSNFLKHSLNIVYCHRFEFVIFQSNSVIFLSLLNPPVCGQTIQTTPPSTGYITSPGYGQSNYSNDLSCDWILSNTVIVNSSLQLSFDDPWGLEGGTCIHDYVEIRAGKTKILLHE